MSLDVTKYEASTEPDAPAEASEEVKMLWALYAKLWDEKFARSPIYATMIGDYRFNSEISDLSREGFEVHLKALKDILSEANNLDSSSMPPIEKTHYEYIVEMLEIELSMLENYPVYEFPTSHLFGPHLLVVQSPNFHPWKTLEDSESFLQRISKYGTQVDQMIQAFKDGAEIGKTLPEAAIAAIVKQCKEQVFEDPLDSPLYKLALPKVQSVNGNEEELLSIVKDTIIPAFQKLAEYMETDYATHARSGPGIWSLPGGEDSYKACIKFFTSTDKTAEELHELGKSEVERITAKINTVRETIGDTEGTLSEFAKRMQKKEEYLPKDGDEIIEKYKAILELAKVRVLDFFHTFPSAELEVKAVEEFRQEASPAAHYYAPPADRSRPGIFYANTFKPETRPSYSMEAIALHEGLPGHHFQIAIAQELKNLPRLRKEAQEFTIGYVEGWGLYTEYLGEEMGFYTDPVNYYGRLLTEIWRAARLVVDTGLHHYRWTRDEAINYMVEVACLSENEAKVEVDRYCVLEGQALAYKSGEIYIVEQKNKAQKELGDAFSWKEFHEHVLVNGSVPLNVLGTIIDSYIEGKKAVTA